MVVVHDYHLS